jgi:sirohydrochlorin cobaltochelatase
VSGRTEEIALAKWLAAGVRRIGQIFIEAKQDGKFALMHRDDASRNDLVLHQDTDDATRLARFDDEGNYRPLKTAPNLRHGWRLTVPDQSALGIVIDLFYPGRLAALFVWETGTLVATPLRESLNRQTGMYRAAARITDDDADILVGNFCRSDGGCLRTILWPRDGKGTVASSHLPLTKFDPAHDQAGASDGTIPLLCQEACNLLVAEARKVCQCRSTLPNNP